MRWFSIVSLPWVLSHCGGDADNGSDEVERSAQCAYDAPTLELSLAAASPGGEVSLCEDARVVGSFRVPPGVSLTGADGARIVADGGVALRVDGPEGGDIVLRDLHIEVPRAADATPVGLLIDGAPRVALREITVRVEGGVGVMFVDTDELSVDGLVVDGVRGDEPGETRIPAGEVPSVGVYLVQRGASCSRLDLRSVHVRGVLGVGVAVQEVCDLTMESVTIEDTLGTPLLIRGGRADIRDLAVLRYRGRRVLSSGSISQGVVVADGAVVELRDVAIVDGADAALAVATATVDVASLAVIGIAGVGVDIQGVVGPAEVAIRDAVIRGVSGSGLNAEHAVVTLDRVHVGDVRSRVEAGPELALTWTGDALRFFGGEDRQVTSTATDVVLSSPARVGALLVEHSRLDGMVGGVTVCDATIDDAWTCDEADAGVERCVREQTPTPAGWTCSDTDAGLVCVASTDDPEGVPPLEPVAQRSDPVCRDALRALVASSGFDGLAGRTTTTTASRAIVDEDGTLGYRVGDVHRGSVVPEHSQPWSCTDDGGERRCRVSSLGDSEAPAIDTPSGLMDGAWRCGFDDARVCTRNTLAAARFDDAELDDAVLRVVGSALSERTALALLNAPQRFGFARVGMSVPRLPPRDRLRAGELLLEDGRLVGTLVTTPDGLEER